MYASRSCRPIVSTKIPESLWCDGNCRMTIVCCEHPQNHQYLQRGWCPQSRVLLGFGLAQWRECMRSRSSWRSHLRSALAPSPTLCSWSLEFSWYGECFCIYLIYLCKCDYLIVSLIFSHSLSQSHGFSRFSCSLPRYSSRARSAFSPRIRLTAEGNVSWCHKALNRSTHHQCFIDCETKCPGCFTPKQV